VGLAERERMREPFLNGIRKRKAPGRSARARLRLLILTIGAAAVAAASAAAAQAPLGQLVTDAHGRFTLSVPSGWQVHEDARGLAAVVATAPAQSGDRVPASVQVAVAPLPGSRTPAQFAEAAEVTLQTALRHYAVVQQGVTTVNGRPAYYRYFTGDRSDGVGLYEVQMYLTVNQTGFTVTGGTANTRDRITRDVPLLVQIINTFRPASPSATVATIDAPGAAATVADGINDPGEIVGFFIDTGHRIHGFLRAAGGAFMTIDAPGALTTSAYGINRAGQIVGLFGDARHTHGFLRTPGGTFTTIDAPGATLTIVYGINDTGQIAGVFGDAGRHQHGFLRTPGGAFTTINVPGATGTNVFGINDAGEIVGVFGDTHGTYHGFLRTARGTFTTIDAPGATGTNAFGVNDAGEIVGRFEDASGRQHGFRRTSAGVFTTIDAPGATGSTHVQGINGVGEIVGDFASPAAHGFLLR